MKNELTGDHSKAVDNADTPVLVDDFQRYSKQQLKYQVGDNVPIPSTASSIHTTQYETY